MRPVPSLPGAPIQSSSPTVARAAPKLMLPKSNGASVPTMRHELNDARS